MGFETQFGKIFLPESEQRDMVNAAWDAIRLYVHPEAKTIVKGVLGQVVWDASDRGIRLTEQAWLNEAMHRSQQSNVKVVEFMKTAIETVVERDKTQVDTSV